MKIFIDFARLYPFQTLGTGTLASVGAGLVGSLEDLDRVSHIIANSLSAVCSIITIFVAVVAVVGWIKKRRKWWERKN